ncbi:NUDIX hydrolase [Camelimonas abortus]|uniref:NUDIX hydrolase n=1 Tax=Camelimonas abortus TaxID=1017184 RepID=A0ABV7LED1_9HYPH
MRAGMARAFARFERLSLERDHAGLKRAAVALAVVEHPEQRGELAFVLTRRARGLRSHGGQWALPGGRCDPGETVTQTALRELREEIGLALDESAVLGVLDDYPTRSGYLMTPVVTWAGDPGAVVPNPAEVASVHFIPLAHVTRHDVVSFVDIPESPRKVIRLRLGESHIHAPTAAVIYQFREALAGRVTRVHELEQPVFAWK